MPPARAADPIDHTCDLLADVKDLATATQRRAAEAQLRDATAELARCEEIMRAGGDPATIARWINKAQAQRAAAQHTLDNLSAQHGYTADEIHQIINDLDDPAAVFLAGDPADVQQLLHALNVHLTYHPDDGLVTASVDPCAGVRVGGGT